MPPGLSSLSECHLVFDLLTLALQSCQVLKQREQIPALDGGFDGGAVLANVDDELLATQFPPGTQIVQIDLSPSNSSRFG
jgi:hypothetical protein